MLLSTEDYKELFYKANDAIYVRDAISGKIIDANEKACQLTGCTREELLSENTLALVADDKDYSLEKANEYVRKAAAGEEQHFEWLGKEKSGKHHWYDVHLKKAELGSQARVLTFFRQIDKRKQYEKQLVESERRTRHTMDNMLEGAQIIGFDWRYLYVNNALVAQSKYSRAELLGRTMMEKYPGIDRTEGFRQYRMCMEERIPFHMENEFTFPDGTSSWFELRIEPVPEGIFILSADISERKKAEQAQQKMNEELEARVQERTMQLVSANKTLEKFSYSVSHDLRSPLRAIDGYAMLLEKEYAPSLDTEGQRLLSVIRQNTVKMGRLIEDILEFARLGNAPVLKSLVNMNEIAEYIWQEQYSLTDGRAVLTMTNMLPAFADKSLISQVWINLISNALKYSSKQEAPHITIKSEAGDNETIYSVTDNGTGFDMQYAHKLFAVFQRLHKQTEFHGTGVGLAIVDSVVQRHGGRVWADAKPGEGATFYFSLPVDEQLAME